jgi:uncharacterized protein (DUF362 family)/Pyruvate/2-oxoacid:ferredoxin oxidoreductase delta subunit
MMPKVIVKKSAYNEPLIRDQVFEMMDALLGSRLSAGSRVLIKPNLLAPSPPEKAMLTHPLIVKAVAQYLIHKGVKPQISDSPAMGSFQKILRESGIEGALKGLDVRFKEFDTSRKVEIGEPFNYLELAEDALEADLIINLPKLKTHSQMLLTLGVKNLFGCIVGFRKPKWHFRTGVDREMFARLLLRVYEVLKPAVTILDGILAMEGQGPGKGGAPRQLGVLLGSDDALALDVMVCKMLGLEPDNLLTVKVGRDMGFFPEKILLEGELPLIPDLKLPKITPLVFGPSLTQGFLRKHMVQRPVPSEDLCKLCGDCLKYCPASAIERNGKEIRFDYDKCIRCYCCIEVCPHGALRAEEPLLGRIVSRIMSRDRK